MISSLALLNIPKLPPQTGINPCQPIDIEQYLLSYNLETTFIEDY